MSMILRCPYCQARYQVRDDLAGTAANCPQCGQVFNIPNVQVPPPPQPQPYHPPPPPQPQYPPHYSQPQLQQPMMSRPMGAKPSPAKGSGDVPWVPIVLVGGSAGLLLLIFLMCAGMVSMVDQVVEVAEGTPYSSGSGFVVDASGYVLTNHHVVEGPGELMVRLPGNSDLVPAKLIAQDNRRDMALIKMSLPAGLRLQSLAMSTGGIGRGGNVAAFGFPLGDALGSHLKLTTGVVSAIPDASNENMLLLDCVVNPGNSGGPLCDAYGQVVGMVTAKSIASYGVDSYGMAIPSSDLRRFLARHLPGYQAPAANGQPTSTMNWEQVDRSVNPAILMILKM